uniref:Reverse transcriptase domain-containing protein n=1 Tax=Tanacetum cinerariifolium TaxID=118510 RepID=A0A6L2N3D4_TANCI|nr:reverse transcriptase domain-containing protein [Tanacetum cinerariifolium]
MVMTYLLSEEVIYQFLDLRTMEELCQPTLNGQGGLIAPIAIHATNFGLKNDMIQQVQNSCPFNGPGDDANKHLDKFLHVTQSMKVNGVSDEALRLYLFPYSLQHRAAEWFDRLPRNSITTFYQMGKIYLEKYFPPSMVTKLRNAITNFCQEPDESLFKAWERYKLLIDRSTVGQTQNVYAAGAYNQGGNTYQPQGNRDLLSYCSDNYLGALGFNVNQNQNQNNQNQNQNRNQGNNQGRNYFFQGASHGQNPPPAYQALAYQAPAYQASGYQALIQQTLIPQPQVMTTTEFTNYMKANDAILKNMQTNMTTLTNSTNDLKNMLGQFMKMNTASTLGLGTLPSNTITNLKEDLKGITTRSGIAYKGPTIPTTSSPPKVVERETKVTKDTVPPTNNGSTEDVQPPPNPKPSIPYPSRLNDQKLCDKANDQKEKFFQIFQDLNFNISFADALILIPKFGPTIKSLLTNKEKLFELARTPLNEHCSAVLLKKLPEKMRDPGKFLILCDFPGMDECLALADLGASINLMPLCMWKMLSLPELFPTSVTFSLDQTSRYSSNYDDNLVNRINVIDVACEEYSQEVLGFSVSGNPTPSTEPIVFISSPTLTPFRDSDFLLKEIDAFLAIEDEPILPKIDDSYYDSEGYILLLENFLMMIHHHHLSILKSLKNSFETFLSHLNKMLKRCEDTNLRLNWEKSHFMVKEGIVLGHKISKNEIEVDKAKVDVIAKLPHPTTVKGAKNLVANNLSRLENPYKGELVEVEMNDNFPHESLNMISLNDDNEPMCFADMANYLVGSVWMGRKLCIFLKLATMVLPEDIMALTTPPRKFLTLVSFGPQSIVMPMTWSHTVTHVNVKEKSHKGMKCPRNLSRIVRSLTYGASTLWACSRLLEGTNLEPYGPLLVIEDIREDSRQHRAKWADKVDDALWAFRIAFKTLIDCTPYKLVIPYDREDFRACFQSFNHSVVSELWLIQMARRVFDYRIRRIVDRGNEEDGPDSRARGDRFYHNRRSADRGNEKVDRDPGNIFEIKGLRRRVRDLEIQQEIRQIRKRIRELELQREMRKETESRYVVQDDVNEEEEFDEDEVDIDEGERLFLEQALRRKGLVEGDGPTVVTIRPVASMATLLFVPKVQVGLLVEARFTNLNLEGDLIKSPITVGSPINFKWQNNDNIMVAKNAQRKVDCGPQDQIGRKDYKGPTTTSLDVLNSLSSKIATTKCIGAELFERFKLIAKSDRSNAPYDPGGTGLIPGETTREVKLFRQVMVTLINGSRVDVPFDPGDFSSKVKL